MSRRLSIVMHYSQGILDLSLLAGTFHTEVKLKSKRLPSEEDEKRTLEGLQKEAEYKIEDKELSDANP